ncbi:SCP2 sterol-binding domain-containing protein [Streptomyces sp. SPB162]|uniref:SCP2 sterol-binding domain-containing protein n=1 Tax=Streptomyces sp. SPB162 TaxID=2940560 RepID=UPI0024071F90|nr:SCP2 sterol-binding domain-containing protein [Streptomyces sp. SPB162]MDF9817157.1 putative sterol carrier protein [Streptomyces sp. SPB162]
MAVFPSGDWLDEYVARINTSPEFAEAARTFEADIAYVFEAEPELGHQADVWARAGVGGGKCLWWNYDVTPQEGRESQFILQGPYSLWKQIIQGELDPMEAMLDGELAVTGHLPTLLRYVRAANALVSIAATGTTAFADEVAPAARP